MDGPSLHLSWHELACHDARQTPYPERWRSTRAVRLALAFEAVRAALGDQPIVVLSGYRTAAWNRRIGGARHSQHVEGRALDLRPPDGWTRATMAERLLLLARTTCPAIRGVGVYPTFVHVDVRLGPPLAVWWHGSRLQADRPA